MMDDGVENTLLVCKQVCFPPFGAEMQSSYYNTAEFSSVEDQLPTILTAHANSCSPFHCTSCNSFCIPPIKISLKSLTTSLVVVRISIMTFFVLLYSVLTLTTSRSADLLLRHSCFPCYTICCVLWNLSSPFEIVLV